MKIGGVDMPTKEDWIRETAIFGKPRKGFTKLVDDKVDDLWTKSDMIGKFVALTDLRNAIQKQLNSVKGQDRQKTEILNSLDEKARKAIKYFAATGPTIQKILTSPLDIYKQRSNEIGGKDMANMIFANYMSYAKANWSYVASATAGGEDVLSGNASSLPCGGIAFALRIIYQSFFDAGLTKLITIAGYLITKPTFHCFDNKVTGNVKSPGPPDNWDGACIFNQHFFLSYGGQFYDPCMDTKYTEEEEVIAAKLVKIGTIKTSVILVPAKIGEHDYIYVYDSTKDVPGFNGSYVKFKIDSFNNSGDLLRLIREAGLDKIEEPDIKKAATACRKAN